MNGCKYDTDRDYVLGLILDADGYFFVIRS